jgi:hypothetical protein
MREYFQGLNRPPFSKHPYNALSDSASQEAAGQSGAATMMIVTA